MVKRVIKTFYGNVALHRAKCPKCKTMSIILGGKFQCCDRDYGDFPDEERQKRECDCFAERKIIPDKIKKQILREQEHKCIYCNKSLYRKWLYHPKKKKYIKLKIHFDHFVPWDYIQSNKYDNIVACCNLCNLFKSSKVFKDLESARGYIIERYNELNGY